MSNVSTITVPELLTFTLPAVSSISRTSIGPSRWPAVRIQDASLAVSGGRAGRCTFSNTRLSPKMVVMPSCDVVNTAGKRWLLYQRFIILRT